MSTHQVDRLEQVLETIEKAPRAKTCEALAGIVSEMEEDLEEFGGTSAGDAVLIRCAHAIEHYEMGRDGLLLTWAQRLGHKTAAKLLGETLAEEEATDKKLSALAGKPNMKNTKAAA